LSTDIVKADHQPEPVEFRDSALVQWAYEARQAAGIAKSLAATSFVPASLRGKPADITAAILAGQELGLQPMATLRSIDVIQGTPALRAHAMRGLVQSRGHAIEIVESDDNHCIVRGRRNPVDTWQTVEWTLDRAKKMGLTDKDQWKKQPRTMLIARATSEMCRLIAADVLYAMPYAAEELDGEPVRATAMVSNGGRVTAAEILGTEHDETEADQPAPDEPSQDEQEWPDVAKAGESA
jgi:hypothetical protein